MRVRVHLSRSGLPPFTPGVEQVAVCDFINRKFVKLITEACPGSKGAGWSASKGGDIRITKPSQAVIGRSAILFVGDFIEARCAVNLPAKGRTIEGYRAADGIDNLMKVVDQCFLYANLDGTALEKHVVSVCSQDALRQALSCHHLIGFVANGSCLPRRSGDDDRPLDKGASAFQSPPELEVVIQTKVRGNPVKVTGMGIKKGVTVIVGGGFQGKSTLLQALQFGIYNKVPGDGREFVVIDESACKIRAEDGRRVSDIDITPLIDGLPGKKDCAQFSTPNASGSTSQAANIMEALGLGCSTLLFDEDTCATNLMVRDTFMEALVPEAEEPIKALVRKIRSLYKDAGCSSILVMGGTSEFISQADTVIMMRCYEASDVTARAHEIRPKLTYPDSFGCVTPQVPKLNLVDTYGKFYMKGLYEISFGSNAVNTSHIEQLIEPGQLQYVADILSNIGQLPFDEIKGVLKSNNFTKVSHRGTYVDVRPFELAAVFNRMQRQGY